MLDCEAVHQEGSLHSRGHGGKADICAPGPGVAWRGRSEDRRRTHRLCYSVRQRMG